MTMNISTPRREALAVFRLFKCDMTCVIFNNRLLSTAVFPKDCVFSLFIKSVNLISRSWENAFPTLLVGHANFLCNQIWQGQSVMFSLKLLLLKELYGCFLWMGFNCLKATKVTTRRQLTFYLLVLMTSWYSFSRPWNDERLSWP